MEDKKEGLKTRRVTEFKRGEKLFTSTGISRIKVTKDGEVQCLEIPITSTGISDLVDSFSRNAPTPPFKDIKATPDSEIGKSLGLTRNEWVRMPDLSDSDYIDAKRKHNSDLSLAIVMKGIVVCVKESDGSTVEDDDKKLDILKEMGMSGEQFSQIVEDITGLTKWSDKETTHFFGSR